MTNTSAISVLWNAGTTFALFPSESTRLRRRPLSFASFTERERRYLVPMNLFSMRQKKRDTQVRTVHG